jgi:hypothetical protein
MFIVRYGYRVVVVSASSSRLNKLFAKFVEKLPGCLIYTYMWVHIQGNHTYCVCLYGSMGSKFAWLNLWAGCCTGFGIDLNPTSNFELLTRRPAGAARPCPKVLSPITVRDDIQKLWPPPEDTSTHTFNHRFFAPSSLLPPMATQPLSTTT